MAGSPSEDMMRSNVSPRSADLVASSKLLGGVLCCIITTGSNNLGIVETANMRTLFLEVISNDRL